MNLLDKILEKLGLKRTAAPATSGDKVSGKGDSAPISAVDVVGKLDRMAATNPQKLNWKRSIVDLLKLLNLDSSLDERKQLATALGCPPDKMGGDFAAMNIWLHKTVMQKLAANGGNIPKELLA
jgi:hypothetical protein